MPHLNKGYETAKRDKAGDEQYTPQYAVRPILKYLKPNSTIWCPFDLEDSAYVKVLRAAGHKVIATHIDTGQNFFFYEPDEPYDVIISNPPFSIKDLILQRLYELEKPYAILMPVPVLQGQRRFPFIKDCQALVFDKRINYFTDRFCSIPVKGISFGTLYLCRNFLPKDLIFEELDING